MIGFNDTITIWNKYTDATYTDKWIKRYIHNVSWTSKFNQGSDASGSETTSDFTVLVSQTDGYLPKNEWDKLADDQKPYYFTFGNGDLVAKGEHEFTLEKIIANHKFALTIPIGGYMPEYVTIGEESIVKIKQKIGVEAFYLRALTDNTQPFKQAKHWKVSGS